MAIQIDVARLHHGGEENVSTDAASVNRGTADGRKLRQFLLPVQAVDVVGFERRVGGEKETVFGGNGSHGAGLLISSHHSLDVTQIAGGAEDTAFLAVVPRQDPQAIPPPVVNDGVDMTNRALGKSVGNVPG